MVDLDVLLVTMSIDVTVIKSKRQFLFRLLGRFYLKQIKDEKKKTKKPTLANSSFRKLNIPK